MEMGNVYYIKADSCNWLIRYNGKESGREENINVNGCIALDSKYFYLGKSTWGPKSTILSHRIATQEEVLWLLGCVREGKYIEQPKPIIYEIY